MILKYQNKYTIELKKIRTMFSKRYEVSIAYIGDIKKNCSFEAVCPINIILNKNMKIINKTIIQNNN